MPDPAFSPEEHRLAAPRWFDDLTVGERFPIPSRTMTEALFAAFQLASADNHPIHYDREYCRAHGHRDLLAHGLLVTAQAAAGAGIFPHAISDSPIPCGNMPAPAAACAVTRSPWASRSRWPWVWQYSRS